MRIKNYIFVFVIALILSLSAFAAGKKINVGIYFDKTAAASPITLDFENGFQVGFIDSEGAFLPIMFYPDTQAVISCTAYGISVSDKSGNTLYEGLADSSVAVMPLESENDVETDDYIPFTKIDAIKYPEILKFENTNGKITVINVVNSETYFKGVLPSEVFPSWHEEALKAAAVATRTYTYQSIGGKHSAYGVDLCTTTCCQVYSGITKCQESTNRAVEETEDLVLTYNGKLITAVYHAISGGITESAAGAWGGNAENFPYLTIVETPFEKYNEIARGHWRQILYEKDFEALISDYDNSNNLSPRIVSITADDETKGYLNNVTLTDDAGASLFLKTSSNVRSFFNTLSSNFTIAPVLMPNDNGLDSASVMTADGEVIINSGEKFYYLTADGTETARGLKSGYFIDGKGYGHGVGMSQYGAQYAAKAGYTYDQILLTYYPGVTFENYTEYLESRG